MKKRIVRCAVISLLSQLSCQYGQADLLTPFKVEPEIEIKTTNNTLYVGKQLRYEVKYTKNPEAGKEWQLDPSGMPRMYLWNLDGGITMNSISCTPRYGQSTLTTVDGATDRDDGSQFNIKCTVTVNAKYIGKESASAQGISDTTSTNASAQDSFSVVKEKTAEEKLKELFEENPAPPRPLYT